MVNGYKADSVHGGGVKQTSSRGGPGDTEIRDKNQRTEEDNAKRVDGHSPGGTLTSDSGLVEMFYNPILLLYTHLPAPADSRTYTVSLHFITLVFILFQLRFRLARVDGACYVMVAAVKDFFLVVGQDKITVCFLCFSYFSAFLYNCVYILYNVCTKNVNNFKVFTFISTSWSTAWFILFSHLPASAPFSLLFFPSTSYSFSNTHICYVRWTLQYSGPFPATQDYPF